LAFGLLTSGEAGAVLPFHRFLTCPTGSLYRTVWYSFRSSIGKPRLRRLEHFRSCCAFAGLAINKAGAITNHIAFIMECARLALTYLSIIIPYSGLKSVCTAGVPDQVPALVDVDNIGLTASLILSAFAAITSTPEDNGQVVPGVIEIESAVEFSMLPLPPCTVVYNHLGYRPEGRTGVYIHPWVKNSAIGMFYLVSAVLLAVTPFLVIVLFPFWLLLLFVVVARIGQFLGLLPPGDLGPSF
jgi:hypothetical protein